MHLSNIDLNLLVVLDALLQTRSVKEAAARVALSPSACSHALNRLRELFDDPLLVRAGRSMVLSARAEALAPRVAGALAEVSHVFEERQTIDPATLQRGFTLASTDYVELMLLQPLALRLATEAPGVDLYARRPRSSLLEELRSGQSDLAAGIPLDLPADIHSRPLLDERFVCLVRRGHPCLDEQGLTLDRYCEYGHVLVAPGGVPRGVVDTRLEALGRARRVARAVPGFLMAPHLLPGTDFVLTLASRMAHHYAALLDLRVLEPPLDLPGFTISLLWHDRWSRDTAHAWLRDQLARTAERSGFGVPAPAPQRRV